MNPDKLSEKVSKRRVLKSAAAGVAGLAGAGAVKRAYERQDYLSIEINIDYDDFPIEDGATITSKQNDYREEIGILGQKYHTAVPETGTYQLNVQENDDSWEKEFEVRRNDQDFNFKLE